MASANHGHSVYEAIPPGCFYGRAKQKETVMVMIKVTSPELRHFVDLTGAICLKLE